MITFEAIRFVKKKKNKQKMAAFHSANNVHCLCGFRLFAFKMFTKKYYGYWWLLWWHLYREK